MPMHAMSVFKEDAFQIERPNEPTIGENLHVAPASPALNSPTCTPGCFSGASHPTGSPKEAGEDEDSLPEILAGFIERVDSLVVVVDGRTNTVRYLNQIARQFAGVDAAVPAKSVTVLSLFGATIVEQLTQEGIPTARRDGCWHGHGVCTTRSNRPRDLRLDLYVHKPAAGDGIIGPYTLVGHDVTRHREVAKQLKDERILLRTIINAIPSAIYVKDVEGRKILSNATDIALVGAENEAAVLGKTDFAYFQQVTAAETFADDMKVIQQGEPVLHRMDRLLDFADRSKWIETTKLPLRDHAGKIVGLVGYGRDVTDRHKNQERLAVLSLAVEQSPASVVITDTQGNIRYVNRKFCSLTGYSVDEVIGQNPRVLKSGEIAAEVYRDMWQRLRSGQPWSGEFHNRKKNGELYWEFATISPIKGDDDMVTHYIALKEDITARKQAEKERQLLEVQLRQAQKLESIGQLAAGIAHEINSPMQFIGDNTRFLKDAFNDLFKVLAVVRQLKTDSEEAGAGESAGLARVEKALQEADVDYLTGEIPKAIEQSLMGAERVSVIVRAMKEFSHPGTGEKVPADLNHAIQSTVEVARNEWKYVAELELDLDPALPPVECLQGEFNQVILNLIINAAHAIADVSKAGDGGKGKITIHTRALEGDWVEIRVQDTGAGIPEAVQAHIFDPFFTTKGVGKGTGQGLTIARSVVVDKHGGKLTFETGSGQGTVFIIQLPVHASSKQANPATP